MSDVICSYCYIPFPADTIICSGCDEYKGIMPLNLDTLKYLGEDPDDWQEFL